MGERPREIATEVAFQLRRNIHNAEYAVLLLRSSATATCLMQAPIVDTLHDTSTIFSSERFDAERR